MIDQGLPSLVALVSISLDGTSFLPLHWTVVMADASLFIVCVGVCVFILGLRLAQG